MTVALAAPAATFTRRVVTARVPRRTRRYSVPASDAVTRTRALARDDVTRARVIVGRTVSPSSKTVGAMVGFGAAAGPGSTGGGGGGASSVETAIEPFMPPSARPPWMLQ